MPGLLNQQQKQIFDSVIDKFVSSTPRFENDEANAQNMINEFLVRHKRDPKLKFTVEALASIFLDLLA